MPPQAAAALISQFATDATYSAFPSLRAMVAVQLKNKLGELTSEQKAAIWRLLPPKHQKAFKDALAIAESIDRATYPQDEKLPTQSTPATAQPPSSP